MPSKAVKYFLFLYTKFLNVAHKFNHLSDLKKVTTAYQNILWYNMRQYKYHQLFITYCENSVFLFASWIIFFRYCDIFIHLKLRKYLFLFLCSEYITTLVWFLWEIHPPVRQCIDFWVCVLLFWIRFKVQGFLSNKLWPNQILTSLFCSLSLI